METAQGHDGVLRRDASRNRERLLEAACRVFASAGIDAPLDEVAKQAGVGIATLYRRFPTRADLAAAVFARQLGDYAAVIVEANRSEDPWQAFVAFTEGVSDLQACNAGLRELLTMSFAHSPEVQCAAKVVQDQMEALVSRGLAAGVLRTDFDASDVVLFMLSNGAIATRIGEASEAGRRRNLAIFLEGIRMRPDNIPLPPAPDPEKLRRALGGG